MANSMQQLDLFGQPVTPSTALSNKAGKKAKQVPPVPQAPAAQPLETPVAPPLESVLVPPVVVYAAQSLPPAVVSAEAAPPVPRQPNKKPSPTSTVSKRGRKSFKEMDAELGLIDVPSEEVLKEKLYYPISEVAGWFRVNTSLLRYWENEFDVLKPRKTRKGDRLFRVEDIQYLKQIYFLLREKKFSIEGAKAYLKNNKAGAAEAHATRDTLLRIKSFLLSLKASLG